MRPRPNGRGNEVGSLLLVVEQRASMRPRPNGRGNHAADPLGHRHVTSFNEAAAEWPRESGTAGRAHRRLRCFNEAAAEWPRECRCRIWRLLRP